MGCHISKRNISLHKLKAVTYMFLICQKVVGFGQKYNVTQDGNHTTRNVSCL
jgi:hypothetical protein